MDAGSESNQKLAAYIRNDDRIGLMHAKMQFSLNIGSICAKVFP